MISLLFRCARLHAVLSPKAVDVYPGTAHGFIGDPTELLMPMPTDEAARTSSGHGASRFAVPYGDTSACTYENDTSAYESSYRSLGAATAADCCGACSSDANCSFGVWSAHGAGVSGGKCWLVSSPTLTRRPTPGQRLVLPAGRPVPPPPPPMYRRRPR